MKIKISHYELVVLVQHLEKTKSIQFDTKIEAALCGSILVDFVRSLVKKAVDQRENYSITLDFRTLTTLNAVFPKLAQSHHPLNAVILSEIAAKINQQCQNIS